MSYKVNNEELLKELDKYIKSCEFDWIEKKQKWKVKKRGYISNNLGVMVKKIANGLATKGKWRYYTWKEDFISYGILITLKYMHNFDPSKYKNAHGYINTMCDNAFKQYVKKENTHGDMKQKLYDRRNDIDKGSVSAINYENFYDE